MIKCHFINYSSLQIYFIIEWKYLYVAFIFYFLIFIIWNSHIFILIVGSLSFNNHCLYSILHIIIYWLDMTWHDLTWLDMTWLDMTWLDMTWHDMWYCDTWHVILWHGITHMTGHKMTELPLEPQMAKMLLISPEYDCSNEVSLI